MIWRMRISASEQVQDWLRRLPPQTKRRVRLALRELAKGRGDIKRLVGPCEGFNRLRIGGIRVIYHQVGRDELRLEYANTRDVVYELYQDILDARSSS